MRPTTQSKFFDGVILVDDSKSGYSQDGDKLDILEQLIDEENAKQASTIDKSEGYAEPILLLDLDQCVHVIDEFRRYLPRVEPFFAIKANPNPKMIEVFSLLGCGYEVGSKAEMEIVARHSKQSKKDISANMFMAWTHKTEFTLALCDKIGVDKVSFDSVRELHKIKRLLPNAKCVLRMWANDETACCPLGENDKFGAPKSITQSLLQCIVDLGLTFEGVTFHVGSNCNDEMAYTKALKDARAIMELAQEMGLGHVSTKLLDIGGGFPQGLDCSQEWIHRIFTGAKKAIDTVFPVGDSVKRIIAEPGRYLAARTGYYATQIVSVADDLPDLRKYFTTDGCYGAFSYIVNEPILSPAIRPSYRKDIGSRPIHRSALFGNTCSCLDILFHGVDMPEMETGEWLMWEKRGAYAETMASKFMTHSRPAPHYVMSKSVEQRLVKAMQSMVDVEN